MIVVTPQGAALSLGTERFLFRSALASRDLIGQAKGMIMERPHVDAVEAFEHLKHLSQESNTKLADVAPQLIEAELFKHRPKPSDV